MRRASCALLWAHPASSLIVSRKESSSVAICPRRATRHARTKARRRSCSPLLRCTETGSRLNVVLSLLHASPRSPSRAPSARSPRREGFFFCSGPQPVGQAGDGRRNWLEIGWYLASLVERSLARSPGCSRSEGWGARAVSMGLRCARPCEGPRDELACGLGGAVMVLRASRGRLVGCLEGAQASCAGLVCAGISDSEAYMAW